MARLQMPRAKPKKALEFKGFKGIDLSNEPSSVAAFRSPNCLNMISDLTGKPVKRKGYKTVLSGVGRVWGIHCLMEKNGEKKLVHGDNKLFLWNKDNTTTLLYTGMNEKRSTSFCVSSVYQAEDSDHKPRLWILDGKKYLVYDGNSVVSVESVAYIPTTRIHSTPVGGGTGKDKVNFLSPFRINTFEGTADAKSYQLDTDNITNIESVDKKDDSGNWVSAGTYSLDKVKGIVTFNVAPGAPKIVGVDNLKIKFKKEISGYADRINKCDVYSLFGITNQDTVFVTGNEEYRNVDYFSYFEKPNYFPDQNFTQIGLSSSQIMGYHRVTGYQAIIKDGEGQDAVLYLRGVDVKTSGAVAEIVYSIKPGTKGDGAIAKNTFLTMGSDNMFLSAEGVVTLDNNATTGERSTINRSEFVNRALVREKDLHKAVSVKYKGYGYFALNGKVYVLDGNQPKAYVSARNSQEYSYEWFLWNNIDVDCFYADEISLYFGNSLGVNKFNEGSNSINYMDNDKPVKAHWETPITDLSDFSFYKTVADLFTTIMPYSRSSVKIYLKVGNKWVLIDSESLDIMTFFDVDFRRFSFNTNRENSVIATRKIKEKGIILTQLRFENNECENFGVISSMLQFVVKKELK